MVSRTNVNSSPEDFMHAELLGTPDYSCSMLVDDNQLLECFLNYPEVTPEQPFALDWQRIAEAQAQEGLSSLLDSDPKHYSQEQIGYDKKGNAHSPPLVVYRAYEGANPSV